MWRKIDCVNEGTRFFATVIVFGQTVAQIGGFSATVVAVRGVFWCWPVSLFFATVLFFPTCQVRVVRFSFSSAAFSASSPDLNYDDHSRVFAAGPQPRPSTPSVRCRTSTTTSHAQCSLPDLNHDQPRPVFAAGPQPRPATPSVRCWTSTPMPKAMPDRMSEDMPDRMSEDMPDAR